jgi:Mrp family chromosome partitioning ATPase
MAAKRAILVAGKGGVGKTTLAANMAVLLAKGGWVTGLLDADIHSPNVPQVLGIESHGIGKLLEGIEPTCPMEGLKVVSMALFLHKRETPITWRGPIKHGVLKQFISDSHWGDLDCLVVDLPAGTGDEVITAAGHLKRIAGAVLVTTPDTLSLLEVRRMVSFFRHYRLPVLGVVENMAEMTCPSCETAYCMVEGGRAAALASELRIPYLGSISTDAEVARSLDKAEAFVTCNPESVTTLEVQSFTERCMAAVEEQIGMTLTAQLVYR